MDRNLLCKKCNKVTMNKAQRFGFVCKSRKNDYGTPRFCAYAARDYKGKTEGNVEWRAFPK
jgi:hypothetical protein